MQKGKSESNLCYGYVYQIEIHDKIYIGETIGEVGKRVTQHVYAALNDKAGNYPLGDSNHLTVPFMSPYRNYKGLHSSIRAVLKKSRHYPVMKSWPLRRQRKWLREKLEPRIKELHKVGYSCEETKALAKQELLRLERMEIQRAWINDPKSLLNYNQLPVHELLPSALWQALMIDVKESKVIGFWSGEFRLRALGKERFEEELPRLANYSDLDCSEWKDGDEEEKDTFIKEEIQRIKLRRHSHFNKAKEKYARMLKEASNKPKSWRAEVVENVRGLEELELKL